MEIDLDTETVWRILDKCDRYVEYLRTGAEQKKNGVFPYVVWIVPDQKRKESIQRNIHNQQPRPPDIFVVITPDEFEGLVSKGAAEYLKQ